MIAGTPGPSGVVLRSTAMSALQALEPRVFALALVLAACGDNGNTAVDANPDPVDAPDGDAGPDANPFATLAGTGLCLDAGCTQINPDAKEYRPEFELWTDGATKRRWIELPAGSKIDTTDMDHWVFPVGTKLWKEFTRGGTRVETRFMEKRLADDNAPAAWFFVSYMWNATQDDTTAVTTIQENVNGTDHDIPSRANCKECHDALVPSRVLGFQAISLDFDSGAGLLDLEGLIAGDLLTAPPTGGAAGNRFPLPGNATERAAFGYLHANCGHCHNPTSPVHDMSAMDVRLVTTKLANVNMVPAVATLVDKPADIPFTEDAVLYDTLVVSGNPASSALIQRMNSMIGIRRMPKLGSEVVDPAGQTALVNWINGL